MVAKMNDPVLQHTEAEFLALYLALEDGVIGLWPLVTPQSPVCSSGSLHLTFEGFLTCGYPKSSTSSDHDMT